jgi:hypothetical protein
MYESTEPRLNDAERAEEIALLGQVMAAANASASRLSHSDIDRVLGLRAV